MSRGEKEGRPPLYDEDLEAVESPLISPWYNFMPARSEPNCAGSLKFLPDFPSGLLPDLLPVYIAKFLFQSSSRFATVQTVSIG